MAKIRKIFIVLIFAPKAVESK